MTSKIITLQIDAEMNEKLDRITEELDLSKSWVVKQAIKQYLERYDEILSDIRISTIEEGKTHKKLLKEYGI
ncbi:MAG: ribbon-helix-helix domain-containing protein [Candidatus Omnitrophica bacterium]|nr:ribbon-helix-helix domain-containing protein [Candidatus Omnitrophota bacterium]MCM8830133.1 ribbon-helix-helix domain-containing protein [Candidatus Omnitrophota bacterium]